MLCGVQLECQKKLWFPSIDTRHIINFNLSEGLNYNLKKKKKIRELNTIFKDQIITSYIFQGLKQMFAKNLAHTL